MKTDETRQRKRVRGKFSKNNTQKCYVLKCDIKKFFNSIDHDILLCLIQNRVKDNDAIWLIKEIIKSFSASPNKGLPLGNITSQLFANIYLNELDQFIKHRLKVEYYIRYSDDFVILSDSKECLKELIFKMDEFLKEKLKLSFHSGKVIIGKYRQGIDFLGYVSLPDYTALRTKTKRRIFGKMKFKRNKLRQGLIAKELFTQLLQSYYGVLEHCNGYKLKLKLDDLIKRYN
ncbi:MAG: RNA-directed DNA polymerase [Patescibacteria group bacterium]